MTLEGRITKQEKMRGYEECVKTLPKKWYDPDEEGGERNSNNNYKLLNGHR